VLDPPIPSWTNSGPDVFTFNPATLDFTTAGSDTGPLPGDADGSQCLYIATNVNQTESATSGALIQTVPDGIYTLTVGIGNGLGDEPNHAMIEILANGVSVASTFRDDATLPENTFTSVSVPYIALVGGQTLTVRLSHSGFGAVMFDNVQFDAEPIPEPSGLALLGLTATSLLRRRRGISR